MTPLHVTGDGAAFVVMPETASERARRHQEFVPVSCNAA